MDRSRRKFIVVKYSWQFKERISSKNKGTVFDLTVLAATFKQD